MDKDDQRGREARRHVSPDRGTGDASGELATNLVPGASSLNTPEFDAKQFGFFMEMYQKFRQVQPSIREERQLSLQKEASAQPKQPREALGRISDERNSRSSSQDVRVSRHQSTMPSLPFSSTHRRQRSPDDRSLVGKRRASPLNSDLSQDVRVSRHQSIMPSLPFSSTHRRQRSPDDKSLVGKRRAPLVNSDSSSGEEDKSRGPSTVKTKKGVRSPAQCLICLEKGRKDLYCTSCGHTYHKTCMNEWNKKEKLKGNPPDVCSLCKTPFTDFFKANF